jgi:hypothetical protein
MMERVPNTVFSFLGISRETAHSLGMVGCGLQLNNSGEYSWKDTTITLDLGKDQVKIFLTIEGIPFDSPPGMGGYARISILHMEQYAQYYSSIQEFLELYRKNRFLRLGRRARLPPWELDSRDAYIIRMEASAFSTHFVCDPRGHIPHSRIALGDTLHDPIMVGTLEDMPVPGRGGWIKVNSVAGPIKGPT